MKKILYAFIICCFFGCGPDTAFDCIQNSGNIVQEEYDLDVFNSIIVWQRVQLIIQQGDEQKVVIETGENLLNEIKVRVEDSILKVSDRNSCNWVRDYNITKVYVTTPEVRSIRNSSGLTVESRGVLNFRVLDLVSEDLYNPGEFHKDGDFDLDLNVRVVKVNANGLSKFNLRGKAINANFGLYDSDVRIDASELEVQNVYFFHRSTNKLIVNPIQTLKGQIRSLGDVISVNRPPIVEVEELYTGTLIFQ